MVLISKFPYSITETLYSGQAFRWKKLENPSVNEGIVEGTRIRVTQDEEKIYCEFGNSTAFGEDAMGKYLRLEDDLSLIYSEMSIDDYFNQAQKQYNGLHILRQDPWECLVTFICSANNNIPRIKSVVTAMSENCGQKIIDQFGEFHAFPTPGEIFQFGEDGLRGIGLGFRAKYVAKAASMLVEEETDLKYYRSLSYEEALEKLIRFPGVGDKVANCVLLFSMDKLQAFPVDVWIKRVLRENYLEGNSENIPDNGLRVWAQNHFGRFAGYANQYLFHKKRLT